MRPTLLSWLLMLAVGLAAAAVPRPACAGGPNTLASVPAQGFELTATDGRRITLASFPGRWQLIYFGYTQCPEFCSVMLLDMAALLDELGPLGERLQPIFVTIDPGRDTPELLGGYVAAVDPRILALTGSDAAIRAAASLFGVRYDKVAGAGKVAGDYTIDHSVFLSVVDPAGEPAARLTHDQGPRRMADIFRLLMQRE